MNFFFRFLSCFSYKRNGRNKNTNKRRKKTCVLLSTCNDFPLLRRNNRRTTPGRLRCRRLSLKRVPRRTSCRRSFCNRCKRPVSLHPRRWRRYRLSVKEQMDIRILGYTYFKRDQRIIHVELKRDDEIYIYIYIDKISWKKCSGHPVYI